MITSIVCILLSTIYINTNELLTIHDQSLLKSINSSKISKSANLNLEENSENGTILQNYSYRMRCINGGTCYKDNSNNLTFLLMGDTGGLPVYPYVTYAQTTVAQSSAKIGAKYNIEFVVTVGDNIYFTGVNDEFDDRLMKSFERVYQSKALDVPWYLLAGNHDHFGNISGQIAYTNRSRRWTYPNHYYKISYTLGDGVVIEILMIDTVILCGNTRDIKNSGLIQMFLAPRHKDPNKPEDPVAAETQWKWISHQLNSSRADYLFVAGHYPVYSISGHGSSSCLIEKLKTLLEKHQVSAYFSGHDHSLQHIITTHSLSSKNVQKTHYIVSGAGSRSDHSVQNFGTIPTGSLRFHYPQGYNPFSQLGFSYGGFILVVLSEHQAEFIFYDGSGNEQYRCEIPPREIFAIHASKN